MGVVGGRRGACSWGRVTARRLLFARRGLSLVSPWAWARGADGALTPDLPLNGMGLTWPDKSRSVRPTEAHEELLNEGHRPHLPTSQSDTKGLSPIINVHPAQSPFQTSVRGGHAPSISLASELSKGHGQGTPTVPN